MPVAGPPVRALQLARRGRDVTIGESGWHFVPRGRRGCRMARGGHWQQARPGPSGSLRSPIAEPAKGGMGETRT